MKKASLVLSTLFLAFILFQFGMRFSLWNFAGLNSDHAIHILMAESFDWTKDWYYWGQNRLGSLMPLIGSLLISLGFGSFDAMGLTQIFLCLSLLLMVRSFVHSSWVFVGATAVLLLPIFPFWMQVSLGHPYLGQLFFNLLFLVIFSAKKLSLRAKAILLPLAAVGSI